jgi:hypothetical protein
MWLVKMADQSNVELSHVVDKNGGSILHLAELSHVEDKNAAQSSPSCPTTSLMSFFAKARLISKVLKQSFFFAPINGFFGGHSWNVEKTSTYNTSTITISQQKNIELQNVMPLTVCLWL